MPARPTASGRSSHAEGGARRVGHGLGRRLRPWGALALLLGVLSSAPLGAFGWPAEVQRIARALGSQESRERAHAAARLLQLPAGSARPLVELALEDEDDPVRLAAARAAVGHGFVGLGEQVTSWLKDPSPALRSAALRVLALDLEARHLPAVARATQDTDENVRAVAVHCLGRARLALGREASAALTAALDDSSTVVRAEAATALGRVGEANVVPALVARASDADESVRRAVIVALGAVGDHKATAALSFALSDKSVAVAALAARSLGTIGDGSAVGALERVLLEPGWGPLPSAAARALADLDARRGWDAIVLRLAEADVAPSLRPLFDAPTSSARESIAACLDQPGGAPLLECARVAARLGLRLDSLVSRVRRGGLPAVKLFQSVERTHDVELLVLAVERLARGNLAERRAALDLLEQSAPLPPETGHLLADALTVPGLGSREVSRLLLLLEPQDVQASTLSQLERATDPTTRASARALAALGRAERAQILAPFQGTATEAWAYGRLLARGMTREVAQGLIAELTRQAMPLGAAMVLALEGVPRDLPEATVRELVALLRAERGAHRDRLLPIVAAQRAAAPILEPYFARASVQDRRSLSALFPRYPGLGELAGLALGDADAWVRAHAAEGARRSDVERLLQLTAPSEPAFVRTAALLGLARLDAARAMASLGACELAVAPELGVRLGSLTVVTQAGAECPGSSLEDLLLLDREPVLRELAARTLRKRQPGHRVLRSCQAYDAEPEVAAACSARAALPVEFEEPKLEFVEIVPPWLDEPAPGCPYALFDVSGQVILGVTDRLGRAPALSPVTARVLDPRIAL